MNNAAASDDDEDDDVDDANDGHVFQGNRRPSIDSISAKSIAELFQVVRDFRLGR